MGRKKISEEVITRIGELARTIPDQYWCIDDMESVIDKIYKSLGLVEYTKNDHLIIPFHFSVDKGEMLTQIQNALEVTTKAFGKKPTADQAAIIHKMNIFKAGLLNLLKKN